MQATNIEIKARSSDHAQIRAVLRSRNADYKGTDHQVDTYFEVPKGRLKLRQGNIENNLIHYTRSNVAGPKQSAVRLFRTDNGSDLAELLDNALNTLVVVDKQREIYFIDNVKFHLDTVMGLGTFVEIEAIDTDGSIGMETLRKQCSHYMALFGIHENDLESLSYSDLLLE